MKKAFNPNDLVHAYLAGKTLRQLAEQSGFCVPTIRKMLAGQGVAIRKTSAGIPSSQRTPENVIDIWIADYTAGHSIQDISAMRGAHVGTIRAKFRERNVQFRTRADYTKRGKIKARDAAIPPGAVENAIAAYQAGSGARIAAIQAGAPTGTVYRAIKELGLTRSTSEASKAMYAKLSLAERKKFTAAANSASVGRVHPVEELQRMAATRQLRLTVASPTETALVESLRGLGYKIVPQRALGTYNLDIALEECRVSVEVQGRGSCPGGFMYGSEALKRIEYILDQGWSILFVAVRGKGFVFPDVVQKILTFCDLASRNETSTGQHGVIRSDGKNFTRSGLKSNGFPRVPGF